MFRLPSLSLTLAALLGASVATAAPQPFPIANPSLLTFTLPAVTSAPAVPVASNWTHMGCWTPRSGSPCVDVYRDPQGRLWTCKACGTTGNPGPGKCNQTTQAQLDRGLWCS